MDKPIRKLSKTELLEQKLTQYLAAKGRLKAPNPKPYLKEIPVTKNTEEKKQKPKCRGDEKENHGISGKKATRLKIQQETGEKKGSKKELCINSRAKNSAPSSGTFLISRQTGATPAQKVFQKPANTTSKAKPDVRFQTPKSSFVPSIQGVRTTPADLKKKPSAAQQERLRQLQEWRESRGISYKRPPMPVKLVRRKTVSAVPQPYWTSMENEDEAQAIVFAVERSLDDCLQLIQQGFPVEQIRDVLSRVPMAQKFAKYWICQARLMEREGNLEVLSMFQEAVRVVREPVEELRSVIFEILKKRQIPDSSPVPNKPEVVQDRDVEELKIGDSKCTPKPIGVRISGTMGDSSVVKYKITATPGGKRTRWDEEPRQIDGHEIRFFTPVRRSVRIERTARRYPTELQEHDPCVTSLRDPAGETGEEFRSDMQLQSSPLYVYRENEALRDHVHVKLVYPEEDET
ncbi:hypothetical protein DNTS_005196 [Danionella cerebrum]|uniref:Cytoskeleton-associated protein 2 C-terminal domain-containing protein n=1 Tax=Danionella cerebrum TaxID=2873325 RepID=A0A553QUF9_9TELE|nr:hypothetical protein DNTS_005196 [Danionella translucida]